MLSLSFSLYVLLQLELFGDKCGGGQPVCMSLTSVITSWGWQ